MIRIILPALLCAACGGIASKDVPLEDQQCTRSSPSFGALSQSGVGAALTQQGVDPTHIASATLTSFSMTASIPPDVAGSDLSFIQSGTLSIETSSADQTQIATAASFPAGQAQVDFTVLPNKDLKPFITAPTYQILLALPLAKPPPGITCFTVDMKAVIHVNLKL